MREFLRKRKKAILSGISMVGMLVLISVIALLLMLAFDIIYFEDGFNFNTEIFDDFKNLFDYSLIFASYFVCFRKSVCNFFYCFHSFLCFFDIL